MLCFGKWLQEVCMNPLLLILLVVTAVCPALSLSQEDVMFAGQKHSFSGMGNNTIHRSWGGSGTYFQRISPIGYSDGKSMPSGINRPNPRLISNILLHQGDTSIPIDHEQSSFLWAWAQFIGHDIISIRDCNPEELIAFEIPDGDPYFDAKKSGKKITVTRSEYFNHFSGIRQQINRASSFIDGSMIYGTDSLRALALRQHDGTGRLRTGKNDLLPFNSFGFDNVGGNGTELFLAGDPRVNQNAVLMSLHTLFVREHNFWCNIIQSVKPELSDEQIFRQAREMVIAEIQAITYNEFLPALLGPNPLPVYSGYKTDINPTVSNEFAVAIFQMYYSMVNKNILRLDSYLDTIPHGNLTYNNARYNVNALINEGNVDPIIRGLVYQIAERIDVFIIDELRNNTVCNWDCFDFAALNIKREREHGFADYNSFRSAIGLSPVKAFYSISSDKFVCSRLASAYNHLNDMDIWPVVLAEDHVIGSSMGITLYKVIKRQFQMLRDGDRLWYQNTMTPFMVRLIERRTLAQIIMTNTGIGGREIPKNVFYAVKNDPAE